MSMQAEVPSGACHYHGAVPRVEESLFDRQMDAVLARAEYLLTHGAFHIKLHFSGEQLTCWWFNDPLRYRVYRGEEVLAEPMLDKCGQGEIMGLEIAEAEVTLILRAFKRLRHRAGDSRLRSASLNRVNGMLGLSFSCDNIHYLSHREFLYTPKMPWDTPGLGNAENRYLETQSG